MRYVDGRRFSGLLAFMLGCLGSLGAAFARRFGAGWLRRLHGSAFSTGADCRFSMAQPTRPPLRTGYLLSYLFYLAFEAATLGSTSPSGDFAALMRFRGLRARPAYAL